MFNYFRQKAYFKIFMISQDYNGSFNRGRMFNIGASIAMKEEKFDCLLLQDVDLLLEDDRAIISMFKFNSLISYHIFYHII